MTKRSRQFILLAVVVTTIVIPTWFFLQPTLSDRLEYFHGTWCVEQMQINGRDTIPVSHGISLQFPSEGNCIGNISFHDVEITFPGLSSFPGTALWRVEEDRITVWNAAPGAKLFEGSYTVKIKKETIELRSKKVFIRAHVVKYRLPF